MGSKWTPIDKTIQATRKLLVADLKCIVNDADDLLKRVSDATSEELGTARRGIIARLSDARSKAHDARVVVTRIPRGVAAATHDYIDANPWKVIGVASLLGFVAALRLFRCSSK